MSRLANAKPAVRPSDEARFWSKVNAADCRQWADELGDVPHE